MDNGNTASYSFISISISYWNRTLCNQEIPKATEIMGINCGSIINNGIEHGMNGGFDLPQGDT